jgi:hypothetical protein
MVRKGKIYPSRFQPGNSAAAKEKWSPQRLAVFQRELALLREELGLDHQGMARALHISTTYEKILEGLYCEVTRQPSVPLQVRIRNLKQGRIEPGSLAPTSTPIAIASLLRRHVLVRRFRCPGCWKEVRAGTRPRALAYWWHPSRKTCPEHAKRAT